MANRALIDKTVVDFAAAAPEDHDGLWVDALRSLYALSPLNAQFPSTPRLGQSWLLDQLVLSESCFTNQLIHRGKRHTNGFADLLWVGVLFRGEIIGRLDEQQVHIRPGEIHVMDFSKVYAAKCAPSHLRSLLVTHDLVGYDPSRHPAIMRFSERTAVGRVFLQTLMSVFAHLDLTTKAEAPSVARALIALLKGVLFEEPGTEPTAPGYKTARSEAMRSYIAQNLQSPALDPETIGARFHVSRATLYRDFKEDGGVERFILARRLDAALMALAFGPAERGVVRRVAEQWGFTDTAHFSREFRRRFGITPSDVIGQSPGSEDWQWTGYTPEDTARRGDLGSFLRKL